MSVQMTMEPPAPAPTAEDRWAALAAELDALGDAVRADLGTPDAVYIQRLLAVQRALDVVGRGLLLAGRHRSAQVAGTLVLTLAKVLENMEIGHNVLHGQYDWMRDPRIHSSTWEWDMAPTARSWRHSHNFEHHTFTNVLGRDRDLGYDALRVHPEQPWSPVHLLQPVYAVLMALVFDYGIALYDIDAGAAKAGTKSKEAVREEVVALLRKARRQVVKDFVAFPALAGPRGARRAATGMLVAHLVRNVWVFTVVFMGHLPEPARTWTEDEVQGETRGGWYARQLEGSCNLEGGRLFHLLTGHLSFQIEHHLFPDVPSRRLPQLAPHVRAACERHGLPYLSGRLGPQWRSVAGKVLRLALP